MVREVEERTRKFPERFQAEVERGLEGLGNRNLETGMPEKAPVAHPDSEATRRCLQALQNGADAAGASA
jgi:hypothetical protein